MGTWRGILRLAPLSIGIYMRHQFRQAIWYSVVIEQCALWILYRRRDAKKNKLGKGKKGNKPRVGYRNPTCISNPPDCSEEWDWCTLYLNSSSTTNLHSSSLWTGLIRHKECCLAQAQALSHICLRIVYEGPCRDSLEVGWATWGALHMYN